MARSSTVARLQAAVRIHREIISGRYPNATDLARTLGVAPKTVGQYLRILADTFGLEPVYDPVRYGYHYPAGGRSAIIPRLKEHEVAALFLLEESARSLNGTHLGPILQSVLDKLSLMAPSEGVITIDEVASALSLRPEKAEAIGASPVVLDRLYRAILDRTRVRITYRGRQRQDETKRKLDPLHLTRCEGQWYLLAYCHLRGEIRVFVPARIASIEATTERFSRPKNFDPAAHFRTAFGVIAGRDVGPVELRFSKAVAPIIRERQWHATQVVEDLPGGKVRLRMTCSQGEELKAWLLSWGDSVRVEAPKRLAEVVREEHAKAAKA